MHIGCYDTESEARSAYLAKAKELKGEFAQQWVVLRALQDV